MANKKTNVCPKCKTSIKHGNQSYCKDCLTLYRRESSRRWRENHPGYDNRKIRLWNTDLDAWFRNKFILLRNNAKSRNQEFLITVEDLKKEYSEVCPILGIKLVYLDSYKRGRKLDSPSVDRIDSTKGYIPGNIWIISLKANMCKSDLPLESLKNLYEQTLKRINDQSTPTV